MRTESVVEANKRRDMQSDTDEVTVQEYLSTLNLGDLGEEQKLVFLDVVQRVLEGRNASCFITGYSGAGMLAVL